MYTYVYILLLPTTGLCKNQWETQQVQDMNTVLPTWPCLKSCFSWQEIIVWWFSRKPWFQILTYVSQLRISWKSFNSPICIKLVHIFHGWACEMLWTLLILLIDSGNAPRAAGIPWASSALPVTPRKNRLVCRYMDGTMEAMNWSLLGMSCPKHGRFAPWNPWIDGGKLKHL